MNKFMHCDLKKAVPKSFMDFCQRAKDSVIGEASAGSESYPFSVSIGSITATVVTSKLTEIIGHKIQRSTRTFQGTNLAISSIHTGKRV